MDERPPERRTLADIIMEKFKRQQQQEGDGDAADDDKEAFIPPGLNEKVVQVYTKYVTAEEDAMC